MTLTRRELFDLKQKALDGCLTVADGCRLIDAIREVDTAREQAALPPFTGLESLLLAAALRLHRGTYQAKDFPQLVDLLHDAVRVLRNLRRLAGNAPQRAAALERDMEGVCR